ncbi:hypothetical protein BDR07DRAFT_1418622 [Suillus spraguei]|nr:hypothetical protein BDR07DRAFT_1418622 [Suillus spraguei]
MMLESTCEVSAQWLLISAVLLYLTVSFISFDMYMRLQTGKPSFSLSTPITLRSRRLGTSSGIRFDGYRASKTVTSWHWLDWYKLLLMPRLHWSLQLLHPFSEDLWTDPRWRDATCRVK